MSEWQDMQKQPDTKLQDLLKRNKAKTRKLSELSKTEKIGWQSLTLCLKRLDAKKTCKTVN